MESRSRLIKIVHITSHIDLEGPRSHLDLWSFLDAGLGRNIADSVHSAAHSGTRSIDLCHTAAVSDTMTLVFHIFSQSKFSMEHQFHSAASDKLIKLIGLKTITMKKNNYDQAKRKTWMESDRLDH